MVLVRLQHTYRRQKRTTVRGSLMSSFRTLVYDNRVDDTEKTKHVPQDLTPVMVTHKTTSNRRGSQT